MMYTPGPWQVAGDYTIEADFDDVTVLVAHVYAEDESGPPEWEDNAKLIAMAPELAESLSLLVKLFASSEAIFSGTPRRIFAGRDILQQAVARLQKAGVR